MKNTLNGSAAKFSRPIQVVRQEKTTRRIFDRLNVQVLSLLVESSLLLWLFQFIINIIIPDHDADAFRTVIPPPQTSVDYYVRRFFEGFTRWDSQHYLHIAMHGYTFENNLAFFPFFPFIMHNFAALLSAIFGVWLSNFTCLLLSGTLINLIGFTASGYFFYALTYSTFADVDLAVKSVFLFAINPASIFFRTLYTESWFSFLTVLGLHCLRSATFDKSSPIIQATICFALSSIIRSNGLLNFGYVAYACAAFALDAYLVSGTTTNGVSGVVKAKKARFTSRQLNAFVKFTIIFVVCLTLMFLPFIMLQFYQYVSFCTPDSTKNVVDERVYTLGRSKNYVFPGELKKLAWCNMKLPLPYKAVQTRYWNVGLFGYYNLRKIPNFLLAAPSFVCSFAACFHFLTEMKLSRLVDDGWVKKLFHTKSFVPYVLHVVFLMFVGLFVINVEVTTRMLFSSSPILIWYASNLLNSNSSNGEVSATALMVVRRRSILVLFLEYWRNSEFRGKLLLVYFAAYAVVGTALHVNFLPWT